MVKMKQTLKLIQKISEHDRPTVNTYAGTLTALVVQAGVFSIEDIEQILEESIKKIDKERKKGTKLKE